MSLSFEEFSKRFNDPLVEDAELSIKDSRDFFVLLKHEGVIDLYHGVAREYLEDPSYKNPADLTDKVVQPLQSAQSGLATAFFHDRQISHEVKLVKHLKNIESLVDYIDFNRVVGVTYGEKKEEEKE
jgi:hypothetical protein